MSLRELMHWNRGSRLPAGATNGFERSLQNMQEEMNHLLENFYGNLLPAGWAKEPSVPAVDIIETETGFEVKAEVPGLGVEDVAVSVSDGLIKIEGEKKEEKQEEGKDFLRRETSYGSFSRTVALPESADCNKADATFKNGMLTIQVPKKAEAMQKPKKVAIKKAA